MEEDQIKKAADFLGVKVLTPLEQKAIVGGIEHPKDVHYHHGNVHMDHTYGPED